VPFITQSDIGLRQQLSVFGDDYPTKDGTCIRDYIHVVDLAKANVAVLKRLIDGDNTGNYEVFNIGTCAGSSVLEVINAFDEVSNQKLNYIIVDRRVGDVIAAFADTTKANKVLGWKAKLGLKDALASVW
jgi:UDP-glucose 4-epimerase